MEMVWNLKDAAQKGGVFLLYRIDKLKYLAIIYIQKRCYMTKKKILLANALFVLLMTGCISHFNVVSALDDTRILVNDVKDSTERIVIFDDMLGTDKLLKYVKAGDTVKIKSCYYKELILRTSDKTYVYFKGDTICTRMQKEAFEREKRDLLQKSR